MSRRKPTGGEEEAGWKHSPLDVQRRQVRQMLLLVLALGISLTIVALLLIQASPSTGSRITAGIVSALAGALIGAAISNFTNARYDKPVLDEVQDLLIKTSRCAVTSPEAELVGMRKLWHHYHRTMVEGRPTWRYVRYPFDNHSAVGALTADVAVIDTGPSQPPHVYKTDAAVWARRLVILQTRMEGDEAAAVEIFPDISGFQKLHAGIAIVQSWSGNDVLVPTLLSTMPLLKDQAEGSIEDSSASESLNLLWTKNFSRVQSILPEEAGGAAD